jgi:Calcineurin-like phosphoesterase
MAMTPHQAEVLLLWRQNNKNAAAVSRILNVSASSVKQIIAKALHWEEAASSPGQIEALEKAQLDIGVGKHGWIVQVDPLTGSRNSVFWVSKTPELPAEDVAEALREAMMSFNPPSFLAFPSNLPEDLCNFIPLADLHIGGQYGDPEYLTEVKLAVQKLIAKLPKAKKAVLIEMGDLLDANDHKGLTPASGNNCDVIRENHLKNTLDALSIMQLAATLLAETHEEVEIHFLRGNHDETAYIAVMIALEALFRNTNRVKVVVTDDDFRVIPWGKCAVFPHHGDKSKWEDLKSVFSDQFPDAWAAGKFWRFIWTAHFHHDKQKEMVGAVGEHFRTLSAPNQWARLKGLFTRGGIQCITLHKEHGEVDRRKVNLKPLLLQDRKIAA